MPVKVTIGTKEEPRTITLELNARKSMAGDIMIFDHADIDIVLVLKEGKVLTFPKDIMSEVVYGAQNRLFTFLRTKGLIKYESIQGGNIYGSMEALIQESESFNPVDMTLINVSKWIGSERPYFEYVDSYEDMDAERMLNPDNLDSTELGEVPHEEEKGSIRPGWMRDPYSLNYLYTSG
jgi:hypothetical protein|tara:strand:- start:163 stop:699 length:537 start_codon:yes stop_codon:yes gene_type:complete